MSVAVGIDVGGSNVRAAVVRADGEILAEARRRSPQGFAALLDAMVDCVGELAAVHPHEGPIGVGIAGLVDNAGRLSYGPNLPGIVDAPVRDALAERTGRVVAVDNDANVAGLAEVRLGAARGSSHVLVVTLGTGIGGAIVLDGRLQRGAHGYAAELGHWVVERGGPRCACGEFGHWEAIASGSALGRMARELVVADPQAGAAIARLAGAGPDAVRGEHAAAAARAGDAAALELFSRFADNVAVGLAGLAAILDPELVVIGGGLVELGDLLFAPLRPALQARLEGAQHRPELPVMPARLGDRAGVVGAALLALETT